MSADENRSREILAALNVLLQAEFEEFRAAMDVLGSPHDDGGLDVYERERVILSWRLLRMSDDEVGFWAESLAMTSPPEIRRPR